MKEKIHEIDLGFTRSYIIQGDAAVMIDTGMPGQAKKFTRALAGIPLAAQEIKLMIITHGHLDHIGSAAAFKEITGARIAMHSADKEWLEKAGKTVPPFPPGVTTWGRIMSGIMTQFGGPMRIDPAVVEVDLGDQPFSLAAYGISGRVLATPGHTPGSVSVLLDSGAAFVGDLAMNRHFLRFGPGLPVLAENMEVVIKSWKYLLEQGARTVYPTHGKPFSAEIMRRALPS
jgi:glyoxylase-like metal-dependent hydrolase (beta-lactamase superfamily II)